MNLLVDNRLERTLEDQVSELVLEISGLISLLLFINLLNLLLSLREDVDRANRLHKNIEVVQVILNFFFDFLLLILCLLRLFLASLVEERFLLQVCEQLSTARQISQATVLT